MTILPPPPSIEPMPRVYSHDDECVDWGAIEADGVAYAEARDRQTSDTVRPGSQR